MLRDAIIIWYIYIHNYILYAYNIYYILYHILYMYIAICICIYIIVSISIYMSISIYVRRKREGLYGLYYYIIIY